MWIYNLVAEEGFDGEKAYYKWQLDILDTYKATLCCGKGSGINALVNGEYNALVIRISTATPVQTNRDSE